mgnify:CR=1 FL=1
MTKLLLILASLLALSGPLQGEPIEFAGMAIPGLLEADGSGAYYKVFKAVAADSGLEVNLTVMPVARAIHEYNIGNYLGLFPGTLSITTLPTLASIPFNQVKLLIFSSHNSQTIGSLSDLKGLRVGRVRGVKYPNTVNESPGIVTFVKDEQQNIKMLMAGRIGAFFGLVPDVYLALESLKLTYPLAVNKSKSYMGVDDTFMLTDTPLHNEYIKKINRVIKNMKASGKLKKMLGKAYVE